MQRPELYRVDSRAQVELNRLVYKEKDNAGQTTEQQQGFWDCLRNSHEQEIEQEGRDKSRREQVDNSAPVNGPGARLYAIGTEVIEVQLDQVFGAHHINEEGDKQEKISHGPIRIWFI